MISAEQLQKTESKENPQYEYRDRLRTWLTKQVDSGNIPGLHWLTDEKNVFRMPWKHAGRQDYSLDDDSQIFKAWAVHSGRHREGIDKPEPIVWKTRLRCALNKMPDIRELPELSRLDVADPYRVYELLPPVHKEDKIRRRVYKRPAEANISAPKQGTLFNGLFPNKFPIMNNLGMYSNLYTNNLFNSQMNKIPRMSNPFQNLILQNSLQLQKNDKNVSPTSSLGIGSLTTSPVVTKTTEPQKSPQEIQKSSTEFIAQLKTLLRKGSTEDNTSGITSNDDTNPRKDSNDTDIVKLDISDTEENNSQTHQNPQTDAMKLSVINEAQFLVDDYINHFTKKGIDPTSQSSVIVRSFTDHILTENIMVLVGINDVNSYENYKLLVDTLLKTYSSSFPLNNKWRFIPFCFAVGVVCCKNKPQDTIKDWMMKYIECQAGQMCKNGGWEQFVKDGSQALIKLLTKK